MQRVRMNIKVFNRDPFRLLGAFAAKAHQQGWQGEAIMAVQREAMAGDYHHLIQTLTAHTEPEIEAPNA